MSNIPTKLNNPGDLKDPSTGTFRKFNSSQEGFDALKSDLQGKITGKTKTGLNGNSTLSQFASVYAPVSDNNDPVSYSQKLANKLGVTPETPISSLSNRLDDFASAIADNEGFQGNRVLGTSESAQPSKLTPSIFASKIRAKYPEYQNIDDNTLTQKVLTKYPEYRNMVTDSGTTSTDGYITSVNIPSTTNTVPDNQNPGLVQGLVQDIAQPFLQGASSIRAVADSATGNTQDYNDLQNKGADYGYFGKAKPIGAGFDIRKSFADNAQPLLSAAGTGAKIGSDIATAQGIGSLLTKGISGLIGNSGSNLASHIAQEVLSNTVKEAGVSSISELSDGEIINALNAGAESATDPLAQSILKGASQEALELGKVAQGVGSFSQLHPVISGAGGLVTKALKGLGGLAVGAGLGVGAGDVYNRLIK